MRLVMFSQNGSAPRMGAIASAGLVDFTPIGVPDDMATFAALSEALLPEAAAFIAEAETIPIGGVRLHAPLTRPPKNVLCVDLNHVDAVAEFATSGFDMMSDRGAPRDIVVSSKPATSIIGPDDPIDASGVATGTIDYEGELGIVIAEGGSDIEPAHARSHVFGYTIVNDVTSRAAQRDHEQWVLAKGHDTFCPVGPAVVTADELAEPDAMWVRTTVNGQVRQEYLLNTLTFGVDEIVSRISRSITLEPGDLIACGTGPGTAIAVRPPRFLQPGDIVSVEVEEIGTLSNPVV